MANEFVARNGIISLNNSIITGSLTVTGGITGSFQGTASFATTASNILGGAANYIPLWNGATTLSSSAIYQSSGDIGINQTSFQWTATNRRVLEINGTSQSLIGLNVNSLKAGYIWQNGNDMTIATENAGYIQFGTNGSSDRMRIFSNGRVGINTTTDAGYQLDVNGSFRASGVIRSAAAVGVTTGFFQLDHPGAQTWKIGVFSDNTSTFSIGNDLAGTFASRYLNITNAGNVGIGTTSPNAKLDVSGSAIVSGSLTVTDTITAQRIVVQTITSSVDFVTGSTRFGSIISNTHTFTGSVAITGSLTVVGAGITSSLFGTSSWATNAVSAISATSATTATSATSATTAGTVTGTSGQLLTKDDRIIEPNSISSGYLQFGFTSWDNNNGSPYADYLHMRSYTDSSGGSDNLVAFRKNAIGMRIWQQTWNSSTAYSSYKDVALVSAGTTAYIPQWASGTELGNSVIFQSGSSIGIGTTSPVTTLQVNGTTRATRINSTGGIVDFDAQTGNNFIQVSSGNMSFANNGAVNAYISSSGNVGIGTTTPFSRFTVLGAASTSTSQISIVNSEGGHLILRSGIPGISNNGASFVTADADGSNQNTRMVISSTGNVGIGTASPTSNLQIGSTSTSGNRTLVLTDANYGLALAGGNGPSSNYIQSLGTTIPLYFLAGNSNNANYIFSSTGRMGIGSTSPGGKVHIKQAASEIPLLIDSSAAVSGAFTQYLVNGSSGWEVGMAGSGDSYKWFFSYGTFSSTNSKFTITNTGDIGVGTIAPQYKLHVVGGDVKLPNNYKLYFGDVAEALGFSIGSDGASNNMLITNNNNATLRIGTGGTSGHITFTPNSAESVRFTGTGDVGIGTTSPTAKLHVNGNTLITGSLTVGQTATGSNENTLTVGLPLGGGTGEGGQILLAASGGLYTTASMLDNYQNKFRVLRGTNAGSDAYKLQLDMHTGQMQLPNYNSSTAFSGTAAANLAVDSSGNVITVATGGGSTFPFTGAAVITGSLTVITGSAIELQVTDTGVRIGNSITDIHPVTGSLRISGSITGSLFGTASFAVSASWAPGGGGSAPTAVTFNRVTASYTFALTDAGKTVEVSGSTGTTYNLTVPPASTTNFADGTFIDVILYGTGSIQFVTGSGVTFRSANNWTKLGTRYGAATLINIAGDEWYLIGNLNA